MGTNWKGKREALFSPSDKRKRIKIYFFRNRNLIDTHRVFHLSSLPQGNCPVKSYGLTFLREGK